MPPPLSVSQPCLILLHCAGRTSSASTLSYLDSGMVFVGARGGDSQLIKLHQEPVTPATGEGCCWAGVGQGPGEGGQGY